MTLVWLLLVCGCYESVPVDVAVREDAFSEPSDAGSPDAGPPDLGLVVEDPHAQWFVYHRSRLRTGGDRGVYAFRLGDPRLLSLGTTFRDGPLWWSPTQAGLYVRQVADDTGNILRVDQLQPSRVDELDVFPGSASEGFNRWSADGRYFLYWGSGGAVREALAHRRWSVDHAFRWIADRPWVESVEFSGDSPTVSVATAESGFDRRLMPALDAGRHRQPAWAPGTGMWAELVPVTPDEFVLWTGSGPFAVPQRLGETTEPLPTDWSRSGEHLLAGGMVWRRDGETVRPLVEAPEGEPLDELGADRTAAGWMAGDRLVRFRGDAVVVSQLSGDVFDETVVVSEVAGCDVRFTEQEPLHLQLICDRFGIARHHVWSDARGTIEVDALRDIDEIREEAVFWSPNGEQAVVLLDESLYELPTLESELRLVFEPVSWVEWSPDSSVYVYAKARSGITIMNVETGEETEIVPPSDDHWVQSMGFQRLSD